MSSSSSPEPGPSGPHLLRRESHDYTEGASAIDISLAAQLQSSRRSRRDSQVGLSYGEYGEDENTTDAVFDGPGHVAIPSSVSRMSHRGMSIERIGYGRRRSSDFHAKQVRRRSEESVEGLPRSHSRRSSGDGHEREGDTGEATDDSPILRHARPKHRRVSTSPNASRTVLDSLTNMFRGRAASPESMGRPSHSRRSSTSLHSHRSHRSRASASDYAIDSDSGDERWGYTSGEEDVDSDDDLLTRSRRDDAHGLDDTDYGSLPPSPTGSLPNMGLDPIFGGDVRIDIEEPPELLNPPPPGPPSRQNIFLPDEEITVRFVGHEIISWRYWVWRMLCVITFGALGLLGQWLPHLWLKWVTREKAFKDIIDGFIVVESPYRDIAIFVMKHLDYPYPWSTVFASATSPTPGSIATSDTLVNGDKDILGVLSVVDYRYARFALDPRSGLFSMLRDWRDPTWSGISSVQNGLTMPVRSQRNTIFGPNLVDIEGKSTISLMVDEIIHPFYVFQIASIILWSLDDYFYYAFCIAVISAFSIITTLVETKKTIARMREMSRFSCPVNVFTNGNWQEQDSTTLVPGDIISLLDPALPLFPADMFLLSGDAIVNESMLTGESVPVSKVPVKDQEIGKWKLTTEITAEMAKSFLYAGTRVVRVRGSMSQDSSSSGPALALVVRTGFNTTKGSLVRSMLFPKPLGFAFYRDSMRFIAVLAGIACLGFLASAVQFVRLGVKWHTILIRALDLITVVVPPALPATLSIGTSFAISRLRKAGIFCISPNRVNVSGKVNVCCFDKTGTLTEDGLDILGVRSMRRNAQLFGELIEDVHDLAMDIGSGKASFLQALATCHSLQVVDGEVLGDPLDIRMFNFTQWKLEEGHVAGTGVIKDKVSGPRPTALVQTVVRPPGSASFRLEDALKGNTKRAHFLELGVVRTFEFVSSLRRMSVIVKRLKSTSMEVYVKGAPEIMSGICEPDSFPDDYEDLLSYYTKRGYRVIAVAGKSIEGLTWLKAQRMKREQAESNLHFLGLIIFENKLKPGTSPVIRTLRAAHLACRMITGDNPLTAVSVARECGLVNQTAHVFTPSFIHGNPTIPMSKLEWSSMDEPGWKLDDYSLKPLTPPSRHTVESEEESDHQDYTLIVTGDVFKWMINYAPLETVQRMLVKTQVFARMSPDEKNEVVERLQGLGYTVLMCGDGANDCAALKAADVGLSLSEAEASVAAPFTSRTPDISCVLEVIKEGRAALVTSFSCFKYMALYSLIQFTTITLLYSFASSLGDFQFLYIDLFIIIPIAVTMGRSLPYPEIHHKRPTASLVSKKVLASIIGQIIITSAVQFWAFFWVRSQEWYRPPGNTEPEGDSNKLQASNYENSALFLVSCFQYILVAGVFSIGPPYRKPMTTNGLFMLAFSVLGAFNILLLLTPPQTFLVILELMNLPFSARSTLLLAVAVNVLLSIVFEKWGTQVVAAILGLLFELRRSRRRERDGKTYKAVEGGMR